MFSTAGNVLRPKRASMTSDKFQQLVFSKGNMALLEAIVKREKTTGTEHETDAELD